MKTIKHITGIIACATALLLTSCLKSGESTMTVNSNFTDMFNAVVDQQTGEITLYPGQGVKVDWRYLDGANSTADVQLTGFKLPDGNSFTQLSFKDIPWTYNSRGWMDVSFTNKTPDAASGYVTSLTFDRFNLQTVNRSWNNLTFPPCVKIDYTVNSRYHVYTMPVALLEVGDMITTAPDGTSFKLTDANSPKFYIQMDPATRKAFVVIEGAKFADKMPAMNMKFPGIDMAVNEAGIITLSAAEIEPAKLDGNSINDAGTPMPQFPISDFRAELNMQRGVYITFKCNAMGVLYSITFTCNYPEVSTQPSTRI